MHDIKADSIETERGVGRRWHSLSFRPISRRPGANGSAVRASAQVFRAAVALRHRFRYAVYSAEWLQLYRLQQTHLLPLHQEPSTDIIPQHICAVNRMDLLCDAQ